jgi:hypothetical protein
VLITFFLLSLTGRIFAIKIDLNPGWNLITVPVDSELPVREFLSEHLFFGDIPIHNIDSIVKRIWGYHGKWVSYSNGSGDLTHFKPNRGYWFYMYQTLYHNRTKEESETASPLKRGRIGHKILLNTE